MMRVFWKHDVFPFCLSATVAQANDDGSYSVHGAGRLKKEHVLSVMDDNLGDTVQTTLDSLRRKRMLDLSILEAGYRAHLLKIVPFIRKSSEPELDTEEDKFHWYYLTFTYEKDGATHTKGGMRWHLENRVTQADIASLKKHLNCPNDAPMINSFYMGYMTKSECLLPEGESDATKTP